ncbi:MAG: hypothetical protein ABI539_02440 [Acidobacteriota bacterium]
MKRSSFVLIFGTLFWIASAAICAFPQQDQSKGILPPEYLKKRPAIAEAMGAASMSDSGAVRQVVTYRPRKTTSTRGATNSKRRGTKAAKNTERAILGFTIWRVAKAVSTEQSKGLVEEDPRTGDRQQLDRVSSESPLILGDKVRIGIESLTHRGYLYVIDREKFADGSYGPAMLIFPTLSMRDGNNLVEPGRVTFIPGQGRQFTVKRNSQQDQVADELIVIVSPKPLIDRSRLSDKPMELTANQTIEWMTSWGVGDVRIDDQVGGVGKPLTKAENDAGVDQGKGLWEEAPKLSQFDAAPQTTYQMTIIRGNPMMTRITLPIKPE